MSILKSTDLVSIAENDGVITAILSRTGKIRVAFDKGEQTVEIEVRKDKKTGTFACILTTGIDEAKTSKTAYSKKHKLGEAPFETYELCIDGELRNTKRHEQKKPSKKSAAPDEPAPESSGNDRASSGKPGEQPASDAGGDEPAAESTGSGEPAATESAGSEAGGGDE
jgi:hypothetical protein